jgi:hypothetical protein
VEDFSIVIHNYLVIDRKLFLLWYQVVLLEDEKEGIDWAFEKSRQGRLEFEDEFSPSRGG